MLAITADNASSNGTVIDEIINLTKNLCLPFTKVRWIRCFAHILNLCMQSSLAVMSPFIDKVMMFEYLRWFNNWVFETARHGGQQLRELVTSIRASSQRIQKFKKKSLKTAVWKSLIWIMRRKNWFLKMEWQLKRMTYCQFWTAQLIGALLFSFWNVLSNSDILSMRLRRIKTWEKTNFSEMNGQSLIMCSSFFRILPLSPYVKGPSYPRLSMVVPLYNSFLDSLEDVKRDPNKHELIVKGAELDWTSYLRITTRRPPIVMVATYMDPRCKLNYFVANGWHVGIGGGDEWHEQEDFIMARVKPTWFFCTLLFNVHF